MIQIEKTDVYGFEPSIRGMRNPKNSWDKSDSIFEDFETGMDTYYHNIQGELDCESVFCREDWNQPDMNIGPNDMGLMKNLAGGGPVHAKYRRMIVVYVDIIAPLYWWKEFDTYKVGTVANSCSTMHKIHAKEFELEDFSCEHLLDSSNSVLRDVVDVLNLCRRNYLTSKNKDWWWQMIQLLPSSYNQKRTVMLNYEVLHNMYIFRKNHKLDEWHDFCDWIEGLPYSEVIIT